MEGEGFLSPSWGRGEGEGFWPLYQHQLTSELGGGVMGLGH